MLHQNCYLTDPSKGSVPINSNALNITLADPNHSFDGTDYKINGGLMNGFVDYEIQKKNDENNSVSMWTPEGAPIINQLASEFAVFDSWFSSVPTCTDPNRQFSMSGTSNGWVDNFDGMLTQQTYFDYLMERGITVGGYYMNDFWEFGYFEDLLKPANAALIKTFDNFYTDVNSNALPSFTWLQPSMTEFVKGKLCPTAQKHMGNQGEASKFLREEQAKWRKSTVPG